MRSRVSLSFIRSVLIGMNMFFVHSLVSFACPRRPMGVESMNS
jgi:hypothetical protein